MAFKLASEATAAWAAVLLSAGGSVATTIYHSGQTQAQISSIKATQTASDAHLAKHDDQISAIQQLQSAQGQQLKDIADTVHDIHDNGVKRK